MLNEILENIPVKGKNILLYGLGLAIPTIPICITLVVINSSKLNFKTEKVQIELSSKGEDLTAVDELNNQKFEKEFNKLTQEIKQLKLAAKQKKVDKVLSPQLDKIEQSVDAAEIRLKDVKQSSEELNNFVEEAMTEP